MTTYYITYHQILAELIWFLNPSLVVAIRSHAQGGNVLVSPGCQNFQTILPEKQINLNESMTLKSLQEFWPQKRI